MVWSVRGVLLRPPFVCRCHSGRCLARSFVRRESRDYARHGTTAFAAIGPTDTGGAEDEEKHPGVAESLQGL